jgi:hypothetical protein
MFARRSIITSVALSLSLAPTLAIAQRPETALERQQRNGVRLLQRGQNDEALRLFRELYEQTREPRALWRMGTAEAGLGRWVEAERHMSAAFASTDDLWIRSEQSGLAQTLQQVRARVGALTVRCDVPGATMTVNAQEVTAFPMRVPAGDVRITVSAPGYQTAGLTVTVPGGYERPVQQDVVLRRAAAPVVVQAGPVNAPPPPLPAPPVLPERQAEAARLEETSTPAPARSGSGLRTGGIVALSVGAVGLAVGTIGLILRNGAAERFNDNAACGTLFVVAESGASCASDANATQTMQTVSLVGFISGGALAVLGGILLVAAPSREQRTGTAGWRVHLASGPGDIGLGIGGRW